MTAVVLDIDSLDLQGQGKALNGAHPVLVEGGLPGERVRARIRRSRPHYSKASLVSVERESSQRVLPACPHYGVCGGCNMQHMDVHAQLAIKQRIVEEALDRTA